MIEAKIILDSVNQYGNRITTFQLRYPKFIHGEFMTHRVFSRNASSSRAIPTAKLLEEVRSDVLRAQPVFWGANQAGMQAYSELDRQLDGKDYYGQTEAQHTGWDGFEWRETSPYERAKFQWRQAALNAAALAEDMLKNNVHKQIVNRILEPYSHINVIVTATEYMNFFGLRLDPAAQPEIKHLADLMWQEYIKSEPLLLKSNEWHLPYASNVGDAAIAISYEKRLGMSYMEILKRVSVARCARVSYLSFDTGKTSTIEEDLKLYDRLLSAQPLHASPAEHQATPDYKVAAEYQHDPDQWAHPELHGNFTGWVQYRKTLNGENMAPLPAGYSK